MTQVTLSTGDDVTASYLNALNTASQRLARVEDVDLNAVATTDLYTVPTGKIALITHVFLHSLSATAGTAVVTFGEKSGTKAEWRGNQTLSNMTTLGDYTVIYMDQGTSGTPESSPQFAAADVFVIDVGTAAGSASTVTADVYGYLMDA